jgi:hypothetical protein
VAAFGLDVAFAAGPSSVLLRRRTVGAIAVSYFKYAVFDACYAALSDHSANKRRVHTVAAPPGTGKASFSIAFIVAMTRYGSNPLRHVLNFIRRIVLSIATRSRVSDMFQGDRAKACNVLTLS